jgi:hypothetical protein
MRLFILLAALSVNVKATTDEGAAFSANKRYAILRVSVSVLPAPAPAMTLVYRALDRTASL